MLPARYQVLIEPVIRSVATLAMPNAENRTVAVACESDGRRIVSGGAKQQRQRQQRADPGRRGCEMHEIGSRMENRLDTHAAGRMPGPDQRAGETCSQGDDDASEPKTI